MRPEINTEHCARFHIIGLIILTSSASLVACGPGPEGPAASGEHNPAQGEAALEPALAEREHVPIISTTNVPEPEGAL